ncbi:type II toxin-antitoxin system RelE/ParE family toxin [bacterium]|nr:type II toxin-antitoxin system RelE/ParE family toxin [bacterium]
MKDLNVSRDTMKFLKKLPPKQYKQVSQRLWSLAKDQNPHDSKQLKGTPGYLRIDVGEYRAIYRNEPEVVMITLVGKRNDDDVYKKLDRKRT